MSSPVLPSSIKKAVFPVAGLGTRFLPATKAQPKEMLPVVDKPLIQYAVEEAYEAGIRHMIFVTGRNKRAIEDHFDTAYELETELAAKQRHELLSLVHALSPSDMVCSYVRQPRSLGLGHAVQCAQHLVGQEPFAVLLADDLMVGTEQGVLKQMVQIFEMLHCSILATQEVPLEHVSRYGIIDGKTPVDLPPSLLKQYTRDNRLLEIKNMVEKPAPALAPSCTGVAGRYILTPGIFNHIGTKGAGGEIQLTDAIAKMIAHEKVYAYRYDGNRYDCGSKEGFLYATVELALNHPELGRNFKTFLQKILDKK